MLAPTKVANTRGGSSSTCSVQYGVQSTDSQSLSAGRATVGKSSPVPDSWNPRASMAFDNAKGLLNPTGKNNCFLNSAIQVLWHLDAFRRNFRLLSGHAHSDRSCIFCALKLIFTQFQCSNHTVLPADALRDALAHTFAEQQRYQLGHMDDAAECFENILMRLHTHLAPGVMEDGCQELHCIPHQKFSMSVVEQAVCECSATGEPFPFNQMVQYVSTRGMISQKYAASTTSNRRQNIGFGRLVSIANSDGDTRKCPKNCGGNVTLRRTLTNTPDVVSIGFIWDSHQPSYEHIYNVVRSVETVLHPADMFFSVVDADWAVSTKYHLVGVVCYYGCHYSTFFFHSKMKIWILFDDHRVKKMGPDWSCVVDQCIRGRYQPLLLLYANPNADLIDTSAAPERIIQLPECLESLPSDTQGQALPVEQHHSLQSDTVIPKEQLDRVSVSSMSIARQPGSDCFPTGNTRSSECHQTRFLAQTDVRSSCQVSEAHQFADNWQPVRKHYTAYGKHLPAAQCDIMATSAKQQTGLARTCPASGVTNKHDRGSLSAAGGWRKSSTNGDLSSSSHALRSDRQVEGTFSTQPVLLLGQNNWYSAAADDAECEGKPYISKAAVAKILEHRKQKVGSIASLNRFSVQQTDRQSSAEFATRDFRVMAPADTFDCASFDSFRDSGYRSGDDRHSSDSDSATLSASNSILSVNNSSGVVANSATGCNLTFHSLCSSSESLASVQSGRSLPVTLNGYLRTIPENSFASSFDKKLDSNGQNLPRQQSARGGDGVGRSKPPLIRQPLVPLLHDGDDFEKHYRVLLKAKSNDFANNPPSLCSAQVKDAHFQRRLDSKASSRDRETPVRPSSTSFVRKFPVSNSTSVQEPLQVRSLSGSTASLPRSDGLALSTKNMQRYVRSSEAACRK